jgi:uracil-DNA glycosylase
MLSSPDYHSKLAASYHSWWRDAGLDYVSDGEVMNWLAPEVENEPLFEPVVRANKPNVSVQITAPVSTPTMSAADWPNDIAALKSAIADGAALPGCSHGARCVAPEGEKGATAFILVDCPEEEEVAAARYGEGKTSILLKNMLLAAKILPDFTYRTALAHSRSATNSIPKSDLPALAAFVRHQITLVEPQIVILFGAAACEAMLGQELMQARGNLQYFNHNDRKTAALATFHPRTLIAQPRMKAKAWQDLQMLARKDYL